MDSLGFEETFSLQEFVVTGTQVRIFKAYPLRVADFCVVRSG